MKWIVGTIAIVLALALLVGAMAILGENGFLIILLLGAFILLAPVVGEVIINWFNVQKWNRDHPWPAPPLSESDLEILRKHTRYPRNE